MDEIKEKARVMIPITKTAIQEAMAAAEEAKAEDLRGMYPMAYLTLADVVRVLRDDLAWAEAERHSLRAFAQKVLSEWPNTLCADKDGFEIRDTAIECGLLVGEMRRESCGDNCNCALLLGDMNAGVVCYRKTPLLMGLDDKVRNKTFVVSYYKMAPREERTVSHEIEETWEEVGVFCPRCGKKNVWADSSDGDLYVGEQHICVGCNGTFYLPGGVNDISEKYDADIQRLIALTENNGL